MSPGWNFQYFVGSSSRASSRFFCSSAEMCSMHLMTAVPAWAIPSSKRLIASYRLSISSGSASLRTRAMSTSS